MNTSNQVFVDLLGGTYPGIMRFTWGFVDVRDVAIAHRLAATTPEASGRYLCAADTMPMREVVELLRGAGYEGYALPKLGMDCAVGDQVEVELVLSAQGGGLVLALARRAGAPLRQHEDSAGAGAALS
ncbi:MAG: hypothetical protein R3B99_01330 [Polyangiales bacterium]